MGSAIKEYEDPNSIERVKEAIERAEEQEAKLKEIRQKEDERRKLIAETEYKTKKGNETLNDVQKKLEDVKNKLNFIGEPPSEEELQKLEDLLKNAEEKFKLKKIRRDVKKLKKANIEEERDYMKSEYLKLRKEADQLREIYESLPSTCYNKVHIEEY